MAPPQPPPKKGPPKKAPAAAAAAPRVPLWLVGALLAAVAAGAFLYLNNKASDVVGEKVASQTSTTTTTTATVTTTTTSPPPTASPTPAVPLAAAEPVTAIPAATTPSPKTPPPASKTPPPSPPVVEALPADTAPLPASLAQRPPSDGLEILEDRLMHVWALQSKNAVPASSSAPIRGLEQFAGDPSVTAFVAALRDRASLAAVVNATAAVQEHPKVQSFLWKQFAVATAADRGRRDQEELRNFFARVLLDSGVAARVDEPVTPEGQRHVHLAAGAGDPGVVGVLIIAGAHTNVTDALGRTPWHVALARWEESLIKLHGAVCTHHDFDGVLDTLLVAGDAANASGVRDAQGRTALFAAAQVHHLDALRGLLRLNPRLVNVTDNGGATPLMAAAATHRVLIPLAKWLTRHGNHLNVAPADADCVVDSVAELDLDIPEEWFALAAETNTFDRAAVHRKLATWATKFVKELLRRRPDLHARDATGASIAHHLAYSGNTAATLGLPAALLAAPNHRGLTPADFAHMAGYTKLAVSIGEKAALAAAAPPAADAANDSNDEERMPPLLEAPDCEVPVVDAATLTLAAFRRHYWDRQEPVVLRGAVPYDICVSWSWEGLARRYPSEKFQTATYKALDKASATGSATVLEFLAYAEWEEDTNLTLDEQLHNGALDVLVEARYGASPAVHSAFMALKAAVPALSWAESIFAADALPYTLNNYQLNVGGLNAGTSPHFHHVTFSAGLYGNRTWYITPPAHSVYNTLQVSAWLERGGPTKHARKCTQHAGDVIFVPNLWEHGVQYHSPSVGAAFLYSGGPLPV